MNQFVPKNFMYLSQNKRAKAQQVFQFMGTRVQRNKKKKNAFMNSTKRRVQENYDGVVDELRE